MTQNWRDTIEVVFLVMAGWTNSIGPFIQVSNFSVGPIEEVHTWYSKGKIAGFHTGAKIHILSRNHQEFDAWKMWILWKMRLWKCEFVKIETLKMWILWKLRLWKCEFCEKLVFENVIFFKIGTLKLWILWKIRLWKCEFFWKNEIFKMWIFE